MGTCESHRGAVSNQGGLLQLQVLLNRQKSPSRLLRSFQTLLWIYVTRSGRSSRCKNVRTGYKALKPAQTQSDIE